MYEPDWIPLSYLSQYYFCGHRAGLLLLDQAWADNVYTAEGSAAHRRVHDARIEKRGDKIKLYEYAVESSNMGIRGLCDCIEGTRAPFGAQVPGVEGCYDLYPVEYKHGVIRDELEYELQLCAQAMCLEEMFDTEIREGAVFYIDSHRRVPVELNTSMRSLVRDVADALHRMLVDFYYPPAIKGPKCKKCSMKDLCIPGLGSSTGKYINDLISLTESEFDESEGY